LELERCSRKVEGEHPKYAWENDWIGPAGRVLCGAIFGLALVALGVRLLGREYRPLGQGLAGAGLASLYLSAYGAHGFYDLVSREVAGALMLAITVNAVLLAARLQARLLATLAWTGAYLTPVLLSTGEDRAVSTCSCSTPAPSSRPVAAVAGDGAPGDARDSRALHRMVYELLPG
jgi:hypothetical protein